LSFSVAVLAALLALLAALLRRDLAPPEIMVITLHGG
jgi:hypothetical protein